MQLIDFENCQYHLPDAELVYIPNFYSNTMANSIFNELKNTVPWQEDEIKLFGKIHKQPRLTAFYAINGQSYSYSNIKMKPHKFTDILTDIKSDIESVTDHLFTSVLLNLYRSGGDSNGWHADNEKELGTNPVIASLSLGASRTFKIKHRTLKNEMPNLILDHGSLLVMKGAMQHHWLHQVPKTKQKVGERINLTFRTIKEKAEVPQPRLS